MPIHRLLVANRGEIAIRIMRAAAELQIETIAVYSEDDARCLHVRKADQAVPLKGTGATARYHRRYLTVACYACTGNVTQLLQTC